MKVKQAMDAEKGQLSCRHFIMSLDAVFRFMPYAIAKLAVLKCYCNPLFQLSPSTYKNEMTLSVAFHGTQNDQNKIRCFLEKIDKELSV